MILSQNPENPTSVRCSTQGWAEASVESFLVSGNPTTTPSTFYDSDINENTNATSWSEFQISTPIGSTATVSLLAGSSVLTDGRLSPSGNGGPSRICVLEGSVKNILKLDTTKTAGSTYREFVDYTAGSVSAYLRDQVESLLVENPNTSYFSTYDHTSSTYTRNAACWAAGVDLSAVAVGSNSGSGWTRQRGGTLITARHIAFASHYAIPVGSQIRFAGPGGEVETRTVLGTASNTGFGDVQVATLSSDITVATPVAIPGLSWFEQGIEVSGTNRTSYVGGAAIHIDQLAHVYACGVGSPLVRQTVYAPDVTYNGTTYASCQTLGYASHEQGVFTGGVEAPLKYPVPGDSGQPCMVLIEGEPVLLWCWYFPHAGPPTYRHNGALLNALISAADLAAGVNTGYTVSVASDPTA